MRPIKLLPLIVLIAATADAAYQKILVPIFYNGPGAGAAWKSALVVTNKMSQPFRSLGARFAIQCQIPEGCISDAVGSGQFGGLTVDNAKGGLLLFAPSDEADKLVLRLEIAAARSPIVVGGTAIPIVRERDFRTETMTLPDVAIQGSVRTRLRIYDPDSNEGAQVRVSLHDWSVPTSEIDSQIVTLHTTAVDGLPTPAYAEFDVASQFPAAATRGFNFNIEIEPVAPGLRLWAFATITDNVTNEVTAVWPQ